MVDLVNRASGNFGIVRLLKSFGNRPLPVGFVAKQLGLSEGIARERIALLVEENLVTSDGDSVALVR